MVYRECEDLPVWGPAATEEGQVAAYCRPSGGVRRVL